MPDSLKRVPSQGAQTYTIDFVTGTQTRNTFTLQAVPTGSMNGDRCGTLQIDQAGRKAIANQAAGVALDDCWR